MPLDPAGTTRFVILAAPRSGSNLLCSLLNSHPEILCHHEVFNPSGIYYALEHRDGSFDLGTLQQRDQAPLAFLEQLWSRSLGRKCVGFKMTRGQTDDVLRNVLLDPGVRKIVLKRRNRIKTYVSTLIAERSGQWEVYSDSELVGPGPRVDLNLEQLREHIRINESYYAEINGLLGSTGQSSLFVDYENLASTRQRSTILAFLGVGDLARRLVARSVKQNPADLRLLISNYDSLLGALAGSELYHELCSVDP
jgi:LPS sulfotransferase NodH